MSWVYNFNHAPLLREFIIIIHTRLNPKQQRNCMWLRKSAAGENNVTEIFLHFGS